MSVTMVRCKNCNKGTFKGWENYSYSLKAHKAGTPKTCKECQHISHPTGKDFEWWFCCKKCMLEYLNKTKENEYKHQWEM